MKIEYILYEMDFWRFRNELIIVFKLNKNGKLALITVNKNPMGIKIKLKLLKISNSFTTLFAKNS